MPLGYAITLDGRFLTQGLTGLLWDDQPLDPVVFGTVDAAWEAVPVHTPAFDMDGVDVVPVYPMPY